MTSKLNFKKYSQKNSNHVSNFVFLTKKFKEKYQHYVPKTFSKCHDQKYQNTPFFYIIELLESMEPNKFISKNI